MTSVETNFKRRPMVQIEYRLILPPQRRWTRTTEYANLMEIYEKVEYVRVLNRSLRVLRTYHRSIAKQVMWDINAELIADGSSSDNLSHTKHVIYG